MRRGSRALNKASRWKMPQRATRPSPCRSRNWRGRWDSRDRRGRCCPAGGSVGPRLILDLVVRELDPTLLCQANQLPAGVLSEDHVECRIDGGLETLRPEHCRHRITLRGIELNSGLVHSVRTPTFRNGCYTTTPLHAHFLETCSRSTPIRFAKRRPATG